MIFIKNMSFTNLIMRIIMKTLEIIKRQNGLQKDKDKEILPLHAW